MAPLNEAERREVWEVCEDRYQTRSTVLTSPLPVSRWGGQIGDPTIADGILDRLVYNAHRIEMCGESMRKKRNPPQDERRNEPTPVSLRCLSYGIWHANGGNASTNLWRLRRRHVHFRTVYFEIRTPSPTTCPDLIR
jgi:hypothetical protein